MKNKIMLFVIFLYEKENDHGQFEHSTEFQILAESEKEALKIAKSYQPEKKNYYVRQIIDPDVITKK